MYMPASAARPPIILCFEQVYVVSATLLKCEPCSHHNQNTEVKTPKKRTT